MLFIQFLCSWECTRGVWQTHRQLVHYMMMIRCLLFVLILQSPHDASLLLRGLKTLEVRIERQSDTAHHLALFLSTHPAVSEVHYPGLPSHPQHQVAKRQMSKFGSMLSFVVIGGQTAAIAVANVSFIYATAFR